MNGPWSCSQLPMAKPVTSRWVSFKSWLGKAVVEPTAKPLAGPSPGVSGIWKRALE